MKAFILLVIAAVALGVTAAVFFLLSDPAAPEQVLWLKRDKFFWLNLGVFGFAEVLLCGFALYAGARGTGLPRPEAKVPSYSIGVLVLTYAVLAMAAAVLAGVTGLASFKVHVVLQLVLGALFLVPSLWLGLLYRRVQEQVAAGAGRPRPLSQAVLLLGEAETALERAPSESLAGAAEALRGLKQFAASLDAQPRNPALEEEVARRAAGLKAQALDLASRREVSPAEGGAIVSEAAQVREILKQRV